MKGETVEHESFDSVIAQLAEAAKTIEETDLSGLAKMHGRTEMLGEECREGGPAADAGMADRVSELAETLEGIILDEVEDAKRAIAVVKRLINELAGTGSEESSEGIRAVPGADALGTEDIEARLARVFDELPGEVPSTVPEPADSVGVGTAGGSDSVPADSSRSSAVFAPAPVAASPAADEPYDQQPLTIDARETEFVEAFVEEAGEHIEAIEAAVLEVERAPNDLARIDDFFRPFHTIKGAAGFLNLRDINRLTHEVETVLDQARKGKRTVTPGLIDLIFDVVDILKVQFSAIGGWLADPKGETIAQPPVADMIGRLRDVVAGRVEAGERARLTGDPEQKIGENLVAQGACPSEVVDFALERQEDQGTDQKTGEILVGMGAVTKRQVSQALRTQGENKQAGPGQAGKSGVQEQSVRIDTRKLDSLVDLAGELVIAQTQVSASARMAGDPKLTKDSSQVTKIVRDVQETAMAMRMIPIGGTFQKMARLVRDVARKAGKKVDLVISGEDTELDKNVIQQINDPLVHMVRNAVDHGIEGAEARRAAGKAETGTVKLNAFHQGGNIVIEIRDDGKGLDAKALIAKALEKGIVQPGEELTDSQAFGLIFAPGFSMAATVTDISGRGVGMDVVKRNIEQLRGRVDIASEIGRGSTFSIRLPLTLAIIDGMVVEVGPERFIIPTINIEQAVRPLPEHITTVQNKGALLNVRGRLVPLVQLGALFGLTERTNPCEAMVVIVQCDEAQLGIVVDGLLDQQQVVIKSLGERFRDLRGVSGAAILGDGRVGLILEMSGLSAVHSASRLDGSGMSTSTVCASYCEDVAEATDSRSDAASQDTPAAVAT